MPTVHSQRVMDKFIFDQNRVSGSDKIKQLEPSFRNKVVPGRYRKCDITIIIIRRRIVIVYLTTSTSNIRMH